MRKTTFDIWWREQSLGSQLSLRLNSWCGLGIDHSTKTVRSYQSVVSPMDLSLWEKYHMKPTHLSSNSNYTKSMMRTQQDTWCFSIQQWIFKSRFVMERRDNVLYSSNEGEQLLYYNCFDNPENKALFSNILRGFIIICHCNEESDNFLFPG